MWVKFISLKIVNICINKKDNDTGKCHAKWDSVACWPDVDMNTVTYKPCPHYINKFNTRSKR